MKKFLIMLFFVLAVSVGMAMAGNSGILRQPGAVIMPAGAQEVAPGIFKLGKSISEGRIVDGYAIIHYKNAYGKPSGCNNDGTCQGWEDASCADCIGGGTSDSGCYSFLSKGAKWKTIEPYLVNPSNERGLDVSFVAAGFASSIGSWESAAATDIIGYGSLTYVPLEADLQSPDGNNEVYFGSIEQSGAIAVTIVWGIFGGPPKARMLVEWDQVYDQVDFDWSASGEPGKMDFLNIATHELGHSVGMGDLYEAACSEATMYGYADYGETNKRTLAPGDITGVRKLYG